MEYRYAYKTSDGVRHEATVKAASREAVFELLRAQGIKAIKVVAADGSKANGEVRGLRKRIAFSVAALTLIVGIAAGVAAVKFAERREASGAAHYTRTEREAFGRLRGEIEAERGRFATDYAKLGLERLLDCAALAASTNAGGCYKVIERGGGLIEQTRRAMRAAFAKAASEFPTDGEAIRDVQKLYGEIMEELDAVEISYMNRRSAFVLLDGNRGKWEEKEGKPVFLDQRLARMYEYCLEGINTSKDSARWQKDFCPQGK